MEDLGILSEVTGQARNRRFRYDAYVRLFDVAQARKRSNGPAPEAVSGDGLRYGRQQPTGVRRPRSTTSPSESVVTVYAVAEATRTGVSMRISSKW